MGDAVTDDERAALRLAWQRDPVRVVSLTDELIRSEIAPVATDVSNSLADRLGIEDRGPVELTMVWRPPGEPTNAAPCEATPCPVCLACAACRDFHGRGAACTDATCPYQAELVEAGLDPA